MIADVAFDVPVAHPFSYHVPEGWTVAAGQRVLAPLRGGARVGMVVALRDGADEKLKTIIGLVDAEPVLGAGQLDLARWIAIESLSSLGSTCAALSPPPAPAESEATAGRALSAAQRPTPRAPAPAGDDARVQLFIGAGRERRVLASLAAGDGPALVVTVDIEGCARWAQRLARIDRVGRLDSGASEEERARAWAGLGAGALRLAVGTRSALLAPLPPGGTIVVVDEHETGHKPPGPPRLHSRDIVLERAARGGVRVLLTAATPSVETWWRADSGAVLRHPAPAGPWPGVVVADTRGILRREALTPVLAREMREALAAGQRVFVGVSRLTAALACDECGHVMRCEACGIALGHSRSAATLVCRLCAASAPLPDTCPGCRGRRLSPFGWSAERVEQAVRRRFPKARVARYDPDARRGSRGEAQRVAAAAAEVVIGTRGGLKLFGPAALGLAAFISPDQLMRQADFRAGERAFALMWAAAERLRPGGRLVIQSQNPTHYVLDAIRAQSLETFYRQELRFRSELGYPPFRRLAVVTARGRTAADSERLAGAVASALRAARTLAVYPPPPARDRARRVVVKGHADLPRVLAAALVDFLVPSRGRRGMMGGMVDVEVDPVEWQS